MIERRCRFRISLSDPTFASAKVHLLDDEGRGVLIHQFLARSIWQDIKPTLHEGKSIELAASEVATVLVAVAGERELRIPFRLRPGEVIVIVE